MRGSPLLRFILFALALAVTALGLLRVTAARSSVDSPGPSVAGATSSTSNHTVSFRLLLSAPAAAIEINTENPIHPEPEQSTVAGMLELNPQNPHVGLIIKWKQAALPGDHRFAKLTLEVPGQPTFTHVFDASGDIDDFLELPFTGLTQ